MFDYICLFGDDDLELYGRWGTAAMAERLRRWTWNPMWSSRVGSNPTRSVFFLVFLYNSMSVIGRHMCIIIAFLSVAIMESTRIYCILFLVFVRSTTTATIPSPPIVLTGDGTTLVSVWYYLIFLLDYQSRQHKVLSRTTTMMTTINSRIINEDRIENDNMIKWWYFCISSYYRMINNRR